MHFRCYFFIHLLNNYTHLLINCNFWWAQILRNAIVLFERYLEQLCMLCLCAIFRATINCWILRIHNLIRVGISFHQLHILEKLTIRKICIALAKDASSCIINYFECSIYLIVNIKLFLLKARIHRIWASNIIVT